MAKPMHMPSLPNFGIDEDQHTLDQRWAKWRKQLDYFIVASWITQDAQKRATLLHLAGERVQQVFETLSDNGTTFQQACDVLDRYFKPKKNVTFERYKFKRLILLWPQANGEAKAFMKPLQKAVRTAHAEGQDWHVALNHFLRLTYRATPHTTTNKAPAELLFNRVIRTKLPEAPTTSGNQQERFPDLRMRDSIKKEKMKKYADERRNAKPSVISPGDQVIVLQKKKNKLSTKYDTELLQVVSKKGSMVITARRPGGSLIARNVSHFKLIPGEKGKQVEKKDQPEAELQIKMRPSRKRNPLEYYR